MMQLRNYNQVSIIRAIVLVGCVFLFLVVTEAYSQSSDPNLGIIPAPVSVKKLEGNFTFSSSTRIIPDDPDGKAVHYLKTYLKREWTKDHQSITNRTSPAIAPNTLILTSSGTENFKDEGYHLTITAEKIIIAGKPAGLFYGVQTLIQLLRLGGYNNTAVPCAEIKDNPRFAYRGFMLDVSRHFFPESYIKKMLDQMAALKLNKFHWHLTDSEGWRIEIKKYPKLTSIAAYRTNPITGGDPHGVGGSRDGLDNVRRGGFYTQDQIREIIQYAADRYITIIPEIEMPGHSRSALRAYPELICKSMVHPESQYNNNTYCPTEETFQFLEGVLSEVIDLFPGKYIHIGGDEVNKEPWENSAFCQQLIKKRNLKDENGLQSYFMQRIEQYVNSKGKSIIGWDEILEGGLAPNATVMSWRGEQGGISAAKLKHPVIMTPGSEGMYFDHAQSRSVEEPAHIGFYGPLTATYNYDPVPVSLTEDEKKYILGVQANLWTEFISTPAKIAYMIYPRLFALAEVAWSPLTKKDYKDFSTVRLPEHLAELDRFGINYRVPTPIGISDTTLIGAEFTLALKPPFRGAKIYYTLNGEKPGSTDLLYEKPLTFHIPLGASRVLRTRVITPYGRESVSTKVLMRNMQPLKPANAASVKHGLHYQLFKDETMRRSAMKPKRAPEVGVIPTFDISVFEKQKSLFGFSLDGYIKVNKNSIYTFSLEANNALKLTIDGVRLFDRPAPVGVQKESLPLTEGLHQIKINYFNYRSRIRLKVLMAEAGQDPHQISPNMLFH